MSRISFLMADLLPLIAHSEQARKHSAPYGGEAEPGLFLVKDDGIYMMSNGEPGLLREPAKKGATHHVVAYAEGFAPGEPDLWEKTHEVSGDDFGELIPLGFLLQARKSGAEKIHISISASQMSMSFALPNRVIHGKCPSDEALAKEARRAGRLQ